MSASAVRTPIGDPGFFQTGEQMNSDATVFLKRPDGFTANLGIEGQAILRHHRGNDVAKQAFHTFDRVAPESEQVQVACLPMRKPLPEGEERCSLEDELLRVVGNGQAVEQPFNRIGDQHLLKVHASFRADSGQPGAD